MSFDWQGALCLLGFILMVISGFVLLVTVSGVCIELSYNSFTGKRKRNMLTAIGIFGVVLVIGTLLVGGLY